MKLAGAKTGAKRAGGSLGEAGGAHWLDESGVELENRCSEPREMEATDAVRADGVIDAGGFSKR